MQQVVAKFKNTKARDNELLPLNTSNLVFEKMSLVPWGHHTIIINSFKNKPNNSLSTIEELEEEINSNK